MPKLTETLYGMNKPLKKFCNYKQLPVFRQVLPPALKDEIQGRGEKLKGRVPPCLQEMALMLQCLKENEFNESSCAKEVKLFYGCVTSHEKGAASRKAMGERSIIGVPLSQMTGKQANQMLKKFPQNRDDGGKKKK